MQYKKILIPLVLIIYLLFPSQTSAQVLINESSPKNPEWVEIINKNNTEVNLSGYYFDDDVDFNSDSGNSSRILLQGLLPSNTLCYLDINSYLNDGGDSPTLFSSNGDVSDTYTYASSSANLSYSRIPDGGDWQVGTAFSKTQNSCLNLPTPSPSPTQPPTSAPTQAPTTAPTTAPSVKPTPTKSPTSKPTISPTPTEESEETDEPTVSVSDVRIVEATPTGLVAGATTTNKSSTVAVIFIICGVLFLGYGGYLLYNMKHKNEEINGGQNGEDS